MAILYTVYITFILLSVSSLFAFYFIEPQMEDTYTYNLTFKTDGTQSHYYVERNNTSLDGKIDLTYTTSTNSLDVDVKNIDVLHIDCKSMYNDESMKVFGIDPIEYPNYYKNYFIDKDLFKVKVDTECAITNLTFEYTPVPVKVIVNGVEWWKSGINYTYNGEDIVFTLVPQGHTDIDIYFKEDPGLKPPIAAFTIDIIGAKKVRFNASISFDPNGKIENYLWDFGDYNHPFGTGCVVEHNYTNFANYSVVLTVRDNESLKDTAVRIITLGWEATPREVKENSIAQLQAAKTGKRKIDKKLDNAIEYINKSLDNKLWLADSHLEPKHGHKVFNEEKWAVIELMHLMRNNDTPQSVKAACQVVIDKLIKADDMLAKLAYDDALACAGSPKVDLELKKCEKELEEAKKDLENMNNGAPNPKYYKAIDHYKKAWEHAQNAIKHAKK